MSRAIFIPAIILGVLLAGCGGTATTPTPSSPDAASIFASNCSACHGPNRQGGIGPSITATALESRSRTDLYLRETITNGRGGMPTWKGKLVPEQIEALIKFLRS